MKASDENYARRKVKVTNSQGEKDLLDLEGKD